MDTNAANLLPDPPTFPNDLLERCKRAGDYRPILFEWYKYVGELSNRAACLAPGSPAFRPIPTVHYAVLVGLLNRCSRLMLSNMRLSSTKRYGETTRLLDRSITESAIKVRWLCHKGSPDSFTRYLADGLKKDVELKRHIEGNIDDQDGDALVIERRMLRSIQNCIALSGLSEQEIYDAKRLPDLSAMCRDLDLDALFYTAIQRMGSHSVHGTWSDLIFNYLRYEDGQGFRPRDHDVETQDVQFVIVPLLVLAAITDFLNYVAADPSRVKDFVSALEGAEKRIVELMDLSWTSDFGKA
jgi:hypothetical protein